MDPWQLFIRHHAESHSAAVSGRSGEIFHEDWVFEGLGADQLRMQPYGLNSIVWLIWHIARTEDVSVNVLLLGQSQVVDEGGWESRLQAGRRDVGTEMTADEVAGLSAAVKLDALRAYRYAVGVRTQGILHEFDPSTLDGPIDPEHIRQAIDQDAITPRASWLADDWARFDRGWLLHYEVVGHNWLHLGQALWVKKLVSSSV